MSKNFKIEEAITPEEVEKCYPVIHLLRPHVKETNFLSRVQEQMREGYHLMHIKDPVDGDVASILGYRIVNFLFCGKTLYIDDFCTRPSSGKHGYGGALLDWAIEKAKQENCHALSLDSGHTRHDAHRLYLNKRFQMNCHHFQLTLRESN